MFFDPNYLFFVMIPTLIISFAAQAYVKSAYSKWSKARNGAGLSGVQVAERIFASTDVRAVKLEGTPGQLSDHYDPRSGVVRLSQDIATVPSVASMAVVAHELGHVQQHQQKSILITARNFLVPAVQISPQIGYMMILIGFLLNVTGLIWLGIIFFGVMVIFMLLTLPVEFDASRRGMILLQQSGLLVGEQDASGAKNVLTAAGLTYVAAAISAVLQLLYYISLASRRR
jgi:Zn-dependent membrane protease YugP